MTKFQLNRADAPWDYPSLGFRADTSTAILDGSTFDPPITTPPDVFWTVYVGGSAETGITRYTFPVVPSSTPAEPNAGSFLTWDVDQNRYVPTSADDFYAVSGVETATDEAIASRINDDASATAVAADARIVAEGNDTQKWLRVDGVRRTLRAAGDGLAGAADLAFDMTAGYGLHLTASSDDAATGYRAVVGIGTDEGDTHGIFVSQKRDGRALDIVQQPGATAEGLAIDGRAQSTAAIQTAIHPGNSGVMLILQTDKGYRGGVIDAGETELFLANGDFTGADVGRTIYQAAYAGVTGDMPNSLQANTTIAAVTDANNIVLDKPALLACTRLQVVVVGRAPADSQPIFRAYDDSLAFVFRITRRTVEAFQPFSATKGAAVTGAGTFAPGVAADVPLTITGMASGTQVGSLLKVTRTGDVSVSLEVTAAALVVHRMGTIMHNAGSTATTPVKVTNSATTGVPTLHVNTAASPAAGADALRIMESTDTTILSRFDRNGYFMTRKTAAPADGDIGTSEVAFWFDNTSGAAKLKIKGKDSGGVVRTGEVALA